MQDESFPIAYRYHQATEHSVWSIQANQHTLDWRNEPLKEKRYLDTASVALPVDLPVGDMPAIEAIVYRDDVEGIEIQPTFEQIAYLLYYSAGITKKLIYPQGAFNFRAAACAGGLYPIEVYLVCGDLEGLAAGVYHFNPVSYQMDVLREGDYRAVLVEAGAEEPALARAPAVLIYTAITWRSSWKYQSRAYRYHFWDAGTMLANSLAGTVVQNLPVKVVMGFVDEQVNRLIGIDGHEEKSLCLLPIGMSAEPPPAVDELPVLTPEVLPLSESRQEYPLIDEVHIASSLETSAEVKAWRQAADSVHTADLEGEFLDLQVEELDRLPEKRFETVVVERGSSRRFLHEPVPYPALSTILARATSPFPTDWIGPQGSFLNRIFLSVHDIEGLEPGAYAYHQQQGTLELIRSGHFRSQAAHICLGQNLGGDSAATFFFMADLNAVLGRFGDRGYRLVQMEAGILGGRIYLGAYAYGYGATGLTFFDREMVAFFQPESEGLEAVFTVAFGVPGSASGHGWRKNRLVRLGPGENRGG